MADEKPEGARLPGTVPWLVVLAEQRGHCQVLLKSYQELEAAAPTPEESQTAMVCRRISFRMAETVRNGNGREIGASSMATWERQESVDVPSGVISGSPQSTGAFVLLPIYIGSYCVLTSSFITTATIGSLDCSSEAVPRSWHELKLFTVSMSKSPTQIDYDDRRGV